MEGDFSTCLEDIEIIGLDVTLDLLAVVVQLSHFVPRSKGPPKHMSHFLTSVNNIGSTCSVLEKLSRYVAIIAQVARKDKV